MVYECRHCGKTLAPLERVYGNGYCVDCLGIGDIWTPHESNDEGDDGAS